MEDKDENMIKIVFGLVLGLIAVVAFLCFMGILIISISEIIHWVQNKYALYKRNRHRRRCGLPKLKTLK